MQESVGIVQILQRIKCVKYVGMNRTKKLNLYNIGTHFLIKARAVYIIDPTHLLCMCHY